MLFNIYRPKVNIKQQDIPGIAQKRIFSLIPLQDKEKQAEWVFTEQRCFLPLAAPIQTDSLVGQSRTFLLDASPTKKKKRIINKGITSEK